MKIEGNADGGYRLTGELTYRTVPAVFEQAIEFVDETRMDLGNLYRIDSAGLALLVEWACAARRQGKSLVLWRIPDSLRSQIEVSGLGDVFAVARP